MSFRGPKALIDGVASTKFVQADELVFNPGDEVTVVGS
jgi:hypothetical protein